ncbi:hypothetical protein A5750_23285 [Mycobacterium sp. 852002-51613_SCH5001154]|uniref:helix-turn-helix domain-containing protein n=1 Tax=Mycobacterium sp. 852002-51613_SCH5001154 TaxID=1834104 RepID=UPI000800BDF7|nr:helix-turn-helix domain-containing protein [Mycobacterium sp. 852002-51613_SCH5001154]OBF70498.1 hypothetical protein A5750_23285 [Mycobacterium sp. 852002-51613_SCH5001154]
MVDDRDREVAELRAEGYTFRRIAETLGRSLGSVQRSWRRAQVQKAADGGDGVAAADDPILYLLTSDDLAWLRVMPSEVAIGLSALERYRFLGLPAGSAAGDAARAMFDHGRGEAAFTEWVYGRDGQITGGCAGRDVRDGAGVDLRQNIVRRDIVQL